MNEYKITVLSSGCDDSWNWYNHTVYAKTRKIAFEAINDYYGGNNVIAAVFDKGTNWDND